MERESRVGVDDGEIMIWYKNRRHFGRDLAGWRYKVACNPIWTVPNTPLSSALGKESHPPTLSILDMHGGQVNRKREKHKMILFLLFIGLITGMFLVDYLS